MEKRDSWILLVLENKKIILKSKVFDIFQSEGNQTSI